MKTILLIILGVIILTIWIVFIYLSKEENKYNKLSKEKSKDKLPSLDLLTNTTENNLKEVIEKTNYLENKVIVPIGLNENNEVEFIDLDKVKNILLIGTTGGGKSICLNEIITSLIMKYTENEVKILTIDTSIVELSTFNGIPHYIKDSISNPKNTIEELEKVLKLVENQTLENHLIIIIDDYYDILSNDNNKTKGIINRLIELSNNKKIHLLVATDTPSKKYIDFQDFDTKIYLTLSPGEDKYFEFDTLTQDESTYISKVGNMIYIKDNSRKKIKSPQVTEEEINNIKKFYSE